MLLYFVTGQCSGAVSYQLSTESQKVVDNNELACLAWHKDNSEFSSGYRDLYDSFMRCPCNLNVAILSRRFTVFQWTDEFVILVLLRSSRYTKVALYYKLTMWERHLIFHDAFRTK